MYILRAIPVEVPSIEVLQVLLILGSDDTEMISDWAKLHSCVICVVALLDFSIDRSFKSMVRILNVYQDNHNWKFDHWRIL